MTLLLVILSVLALWALLGLLIFGLLFIIKSLQGVRRHLEKIAMGVRAIEHQARPLGAHTEAVHASLIRTGDLVGSVAGRFAEADRRLERAERVLRRRG